MKKVALFLLGLFLWCNSQGMNCASGLIDQQLPEIPLTIENDSLLLRKALSMGGEDLSCLLLELRDHYYKDQKYRQSAIFGNALAEREGRRDIYNNHFVLAKSYFEVGLTDSCLMYSIPIVLDCLDDPMKEESKTIAALKFVTVTLMEKLQFDVAKEFLDYGLKVVAEKGLEEEMLYGELMYGLGVWEARTDEGDAVGRFEGVVEWCEKNVTERKAMKFRCLSLLIRLYCFEDEIEKAKGNIYKLNFIAEECKDLVPADLLNRKLNESFLYLIESDFASLDAISKEIENDLLDPKLNLSTKLKATLFLCANDSDRMNEKKFEARIKGLLSEFDKKSIFLNSYPDLKNTIVSDYWVFRLKKFIDNPKSFNELEIVEMKRLSVEMFNGVLRSISNNYNVGSSFEIDGDEVLLLDEIVLLYYHLYINGYDKEDSFEQFVIFLELNKSFSINLEVLKKEQQKDNSAFEITSCFFDDSKSTEYSLDDTKQKLETRFDCLVSKFDKIAEMNDSFRSLFLNQNDATKKLRKYLDDHPKTTYLNYFLELDGIYLALSNSKEKIIVKTADIGKDSLEVLLSNFREVIINSDKTKGFEDLGFDIYNLLLKEVETNLTSDLILYPHRALNTLPFNALLTEGVKEFGHYSKYPYLIRDKSLSFVNSTVGFIFQMENWKDQRIGIVGVAPDFEDSTKVSLIREGLGALKYNRKEVEDISKYFNNTRKVIGNFSPLNVKDEIATSNAIHFATHTILDSVSMEYQVVLKNIRNEFYSVDLKDIILESKNLVVLSACHSGFGEERIGVGINSLNNELFSLGVSSTVSNLWEANDYSSYKLFDQFYGSLNENKSVKESIRQAQLVYLDNTQNELCKPKYWAGLMSFGYTEQSLRINKNVDSVLLYVLAGSLMLILSFYIFRIRNRRIRN